MGFSIGDRVQCIDDRSDVDTGVVTDISEVGLYRVMFEESGDLGWWHENMLYRVQQVGD